MPGDDKTANVYLMDLDAVDQLLEACASAMAYDINSELIWQEDGSTSAQLMKFAGNAVRCLPIVGQVIGGISYARHGQYFVEGAGSETVDIKAPKFRADKQSFHDLFRRRFVQAATAGPLPLMTYLNERVQYTARAWANVRWKFEAARAVNKVVTAELEGAIRRTDIIKVLAAASFNVALSFVPGGVLTMTLVDLGYSVTCRLVSAAAGMPESNVVAYVKKQAADTAKNGAVNAGQNVVQFGIRSQMMPAVEDAERRLVDRLDRYAQQSGQELTRAQRRRVGAGVRQLQAAETAAARRTMQGRIVGGGVAAGIGLFFMKDDLLRAAGELATELGSAGDTDAWEQRFTR